MANWYGSARSNYFRVKDDTAFRAMAKSVGLGVWENDEDKSLLAVYPLDNDSGGWPSSKFNEATNDYDEIDLADEIAPHLAEGEVAVLMEVGAEKLRYLSGTAIAVNHKGETTAVSLDDIYALAAKTFKVDVEDITACTY